jgi:hypothetical protein
MAADNRARKMLDDRMRNAEWNRKQDKYLEWGGLIAGFIIVLAFLVVAYLLVSGGQPVAGTVLGTVDITAVAAVFVWRNPRAAVRAA